MLDLEKLEADKKKLEAMVTQPQIQAYRLQGALAYVIDNINTPKEKKE